MRMKLALLLHPNTVPEVVHRQLWTEDDVAEVLACEPAALASFAFQRGKLAWECNRLLAETPVNRAAEVLVGESNYLHLRGPVLVTKDRANQGLNKQELAELTVRLASLRRSG